MIHITKNKNFVFVLLFIVPALLIAQPKELPKAKVQIKIGFASNYVSKGIDQFSDRALQKNQQFGSNTGAPLFQPTITVSRAGFYFRAKTYIAMEGREDQDVDRFIQNGPGGRNLLSGLSSLPEQIEALEKNSGLFDSSGQPNSLRDNITGPLANPECLSENTCVPSYYKEKNGLIRKEEIKSYYGYKRKTSIGRIGFTLKYKFALNKNVDRSSSNTFIFDYSLPGLSQLQFYSETSIRGSRNYYRIRWVDKITIAEPGGNDLKLEYLTGAGYRIRDHLRGFQDVTSRIGLFYNGFRVGANVAWRPDLRIHDADRSNPGSDRLPVWLIGDSSRADGQVPDPSRLNGPANVLFNEALQERLEESGIIYTYTPRQKLPRTLLWVDFSYTFEIN